MLGEVRDAELLGRKRVFEIVNLGRQRLDLQTHESYEATS